MSSPPKPRRRRAQSVALQLFCLAESLLFAAEAAASEIEVEAEEEPAVEELFLGDIASTQDEMELQISAFPRIDISSEVILLGAPIEVEFGVTDRLQLEAGILPELLLAEPDRTGGLSALSVGMAYGFVKSEGGGPTLSAGVEGTIPISPPPPLERRASVELSASAYQSFDVVHADLTAGVEFELEREAGETSLHANPSLSAGLMLPLGSYVPIAELAVGLEEELLLQAALGAIWRALPQMQLGLAVFVESEDISAPDFGGFMSVTLEFEFAGRPEED